MVIAKKDMIKVTQKGDYVLFLTEKPNLLLLLELRSCYTLTWLEEKGIIDISETIKQNKDIFLSKGKYRIYAVNGESDVINMFHLELSVGDRMWQGYLLPQGLPNKKHPIKQFIPTKEIIKGSTQ